MAIFRYILYLSLFFITIPTSTAEPIFLISGYNADSIQILYTILSEQYSLWLVFLVIGVIGGLLWRRRIFLEDICWVIVLITLSLGFACVLLRVKLMM
jgi:hypothetical protein